MASPKGSIILPVYNGEKYVSGAIESILAQTFTDFELIAVNDCSTDGTLQILREFARKDSRVKVVENVVNLKLPRTLNAGFAAASGTYWTWTSDDNLYRPNAIQRLVETLEENPDCDMVYSDYTFIDENGVKTGDAILDGPEHMVGGNHIGASFLYTRRIAEEIGGYDPDMFLTEDYDYWIRIYSKGKVIHLAEDLYQYRRHGGSLTETRKEKVRYQVSRTLIKNLCLSVSGGKRKPFAV